MSFSPSDFELKAESEQMPLYTFDGEESGMFLLVASSHSTVAKDALREHNRYYAQHIHKEKDPVKKEEMANECRRRYVQKLVTGWSFKEDFSEFPAWLKKCPHLYDQIDVFSAHSGNYMAKKSKNSASTQDSSLTDDE